MTRTQRQALAFVLTLGAAAALAPLLANELPLLVLRGRGVEMPALAAFATADVFWIAGLAGAAAAMMLRGKRRVSALLALVVVAALAAALHRPTTGAWEDWDAVRAGGAFMVRAPVAHGFREQDLAARFAAPAALRLLGADGLGRDVGARLLFGLRTSLFVGVGGALAALIAGLALGALAGCGRRIGGALGSWVIQTGLCLPSFVVLVAVQAMVRPGLGGLVLLLGALGAPAIGRFVRQETLRVREAPFVLAARGLGLHPAVVVLRHVLPAAAAPALVAAAFAVSGNMLAEAALSFLDLGLREPIPSLGEMLKEGREAAPHGAHLVLIPGLVIAAVTLAAQTLAEAVRAHFDPRVGEAAS